MPILPENFPAVKSAEDERYCAFSGGRGLQHPGRRPPLLGDLLGPLFARPYRGPRLELGTVCVDCGRRATGIHSVTLEPRCDWHLSDRLPAHLLRELATRPKIYSEAHTPSVTKGKHGQRKRTARAR